MDGDFQLSAQDLTFQRGSERIINNLGLHLNNSEIVALLGTNGAGKTTLLNLLSGVLRPRSGTVKLAGHDVHHHPHCRRHLGYLPDRPPLYDEATIEQQLFFCAKLFGIAPTDRHQCIDSAIERWDLEERRGQPTRTLSKGWRQRCGLAQASLHQPKLLLLDEPGEGLDPSQLLHMRTTLRQMADEDMGILISTHLLDEARQLADRVLILKDGQIHHELHADEFRKAGSLETHFLGTNEIEAT